MNARLAVLENKRLVNELIETSKRVAERKNISLDAAIDYGVNVRVKFAKSNNEKVAWEIRGEEAKKSI